MNKQKRFIVQLILIIASINCYGQFTPVTTTMRTPYGNVPYTYYVPGPRYYYGGQGNISFKYDFTIDFGNDSSLTTLTKINLSDERHFLKVKVNKVKTEIKPGDTRSISRITYEGQKLVGIPADTCWLFKVRSGKINLYSFLAEMDLNYVIAMQEGDGPIVKIRKEPLLAIMEGDEELQKLIKRGKYIKAVERYNKK
jgi:hypothetical protein